MKNKVYFQTSIRWSLYSLLPIFLGNGAGLYLLIDYMIQWKISQGQTQNFRVLLLGIISNIIGIYLFLGMEQGCIFLRKEEIYIPRDWRGRRGRIQYKTRTKYTEIADIKLEFSHQDSKGQGFGISKNLFLVITTVCGAQHRYQVRNMRNKTIIKLIDDIKTRMIACGNNNLIQDTSAIMSAIEGQNRWSPEI